MAQTDLFNLLSSNVYLHNNPDNFENIASDLSSVNYKDFAWVDEVNEDLDRLISSCEAIEKQFYADLGVSGREEFERTFLMGETIADPPTINNIVGHIINSQSFIDILQRQYQIALNNVAKKIKAENSYVLSGGQDTLTKLINDLYKNVKTTVKHPNRDKIAKDVTNDVVIETKRLVTNPNGEAITFLKENFNKYFPNEQKQIKIFINRFQQEINKSLDASSLSSLSGAIGYVLEIYFPIVFGKKWENQGNLTQDNKKVAADLKVCISKKTGREYLIQLKNSFSQSTFGNIKVQDALNYATLSNKVGTYNNQVENQLDYLVGNIVYLKQNRESYLSLRKIDGASDFIKFIFNSIIVVFLGEAIAREGKEKIEFEPKNNFFIYKGRYLIPMSSFFKSAKVVIENALQNKNDKTLGLIQIPAIEDLTSTSGPSYENLLNEKKKALKNIAPADPQNYIYPEPILSKGRGKAMNVAFGIKTKGFRYTMSMDNLKNGILRNV